MSRLTEKDIAIQRYLDENTFELKNNEPASPEMEAYMAVFDALKSSPASAGPSFDFSRKVVAKIRMKEQSQFLFRRHIYAAIFLLAVICLLFLGISATDQHLAGKLLHLTSSFKWIICIGLFTYLLVEYLNYKLVRK